MAGLCHDLGHGPFSHVFDNELLPRLGITDFHHEDMSGLLFYRALERALPESDELQLIEAEDPMAFRLVKDMIANGKGKGDQRASAPAGRRYLFDIVSNTTNSIDVDKFDYILRDAYYTGVKVAFEHKPVTATMQVGDVLYHVDD